MSVHRATATRLAVFVVERFPPLAYLPLICLLTGAGYVPSAVASGAPLEPLRYAVAVAIVTAAFLHMRIADELKDAAVDRLGRPSRPLPRGLVTERELMLTAASLLVLAAGLAATLGPRPLLAFLVAAGYIALADTEFLGRTREHRDLVRYALVHSPTVPVLLTFAWFAARGAGTDPGLAGLVLLGWGTGVGLEVARKTYAPGEERPFVETYSAAIGRRRALVLAGATLGIGMLGAASYAVLAGASGVALGALAAACAAPAAMRALGHAGRRATELAGTVIGVVALCCPIGIALATRGAST